MKNIHKILPLFLIFYFLFISFNYAQDKKAKQNDLQDMHLYGPVKSIKQTQLSNEEIEQFDEITIKPEDSTFNSWINYHIFNKEGLFIYHNFYESYESLSTKSIYKYDDKGNPIEWNNYKTDGSLDHQETFKYDDEGNMIESAEYNFDGSLMSKINTIYDDKGNKIGHFYYKSHGKYYVYFGKQLKNYTRLFYYYTYDENQNLIEEYNYNSDGRLESLSKFKYDNKGNRIELNTYKADNTLESRITTKFDEKGNEIEVNFYNANGILYTKSVSKYDTTGNRIEYYHYNTNDNSEVSLDAKVYRKFDDNGNEIESQKYNASGELISTVTSKYDANGNVIELISYNTKNDSIDSMEKFKYDDRNNLTEYYEFYANGNIEYKYTLRYEYDKMGNWIKEYFFEDEVQYPIFEREIEYY